MKSTATCARPREGDGIAVEEGARTGERAARADLQGSSSAMEAFAEILGHGSAFAISVRLVDAGGARELSRERRRS